MSEVSIYQKQNEPDMLLLIKTQREIYSKAKKYSTREYQLVLF